MAKHRKERGKARFKMANDQDGVVPCSLPATGVQQTKRTQGLVSLKLVRASQDVTDKEGRREQASRFRPLFSS